MLKQQMGHKKLETTLIYTQIVSFNEEEEFYSVTAKTVEEARKLIEQGFEYVTEVDNVKLFRKRGIVYVCNECRGWIRAGLVRAIKKRLREERQSERLSRVVQEEILCYRNQLSTNILFQITLDIFTSIFRIFGLFTLSATFCNDSNANRLENISSPCSSLSILE